MLLALELLLTLLNREGFSCVSAAADAAVPAIRKRTQLRHFSTSSSGISARLRGGMFDPYMGVSRDLSADFDERALSMSMSMGMDYLMDTSLNCTYAQTAPSPFQYQPCEDPNLVPVEVTTITDNYAKEDSTGVSLASVPEDGSATVLVFERANGSMEPNTTYIDPLCLPKGKYLLTVNDNDGYMNPGEVSVKIKGQEVFWVKVPKVPSFSQLIDVGYETEMDEVDKGWLDGHNSRRQKFHGENDVDYKPLDWSKTLKDSAAASAAEIASTCVVGRKADPYGRSVSIQKRKMVQPCEVQPETVLHYFYDRKVSLSYPDNNQMTQIVWRGSRLVGCASIIEPFLAPVINATTNTTEDGQFYCHVAVCEYARPGNCETSEENWLEKTLADRSACGLQCLSNVTEGCH